MKKILLTTALLVAGLTYAQDNLVANADNLTSENKVLVAKNDSFLLGELDVKSKKSRPVGKDAYYFENDTQGKGFFLESFFFKVDQAKYRTKLQVRLYKKKDFNQEVYTDEGTVSYPSYVPGDEIKTQDIIVYVDSGQKGLVEVDLSSFDVVIPLGGVFVSLELVNYLDENGVAVQRPKFKRNELTTIEFHPSATDNYCGRAGIYGTDTEFWINSNKSLKTDYKYAFKKEVPEKMLIAPNFGLKVGIK
ncbi:MAG: hypothetical protein DI539_12900 [Flavobacterium psychrophilum]|nr:MAG: hypothetical protein DI539_12900 [Flavobacterium psychrophilum]